MPEMNNNLPAITTDEWTRFDMWAERAHEAAQEAIAAERARGATISDCTSGLCDAYSRAADIYRDLAGACAPNPTPQAAEPSTVTIN